jgi:Asp-tRNA(Asn)/Glu-tRNA(Gln) amidotransferase A subunit family amidase
MACFYSAPLAWDPTGVDRRNIAPGSTAGLPGLVLAAGLAAGLPVGIEIDGPAGSDRKLLGIGLAIEAALGVLRL